jgi:hypothetical protein
MSYQSISRPALIGTVIVLLFLAGCRTGNVGPGSNTNANTPPPPSPPASLDRGDLKLDYQPRQHRRPGAEEHKVASDPQALQQVIDDLNKKIALPFDLAIVFKDCDEPDAYYDPEVHSVNLCYQLIDDYYDLFATKIKDKEKLDEAVRGATASTFFHELGHALVDAWKIPITGREEDAVDQLSNIVLLRHSQRGEQMALNGAQSFKLYADLYKGDKKIYWDEHSLDEQRFYDTICMIYGSNPDKYEYLIDDGTLPEERADICPEDFQKISGSWQKLVAPYLLQPPPAK